jgi:hypothetical protein
MALLLVERAGVRLAAQFLARRGAGFALTCRVLAEPARRRAASAPDCEERTRPAPLRDR